MSTLPGDEAGGLTKAGLNDEGVAETVYCPSPELPVPEKR
jgi:hypothetical protein